MADISVTAANVVQVGTGNIGQQGLLAAATITAGEPLYINSSTNALALAGNGLTTPGFIVSGIALANAAAGQPVVFGVSGIRLTISTSLVVGAPYFLSNNAGKICPVGDLATGYNVVLLGFAISATDIIFGFNNTGLVHA
jgi:hypothetical protein